MWENPPLWISSCRRTRLKKKSKPNQKKSKAKNKTQPTQIKLNELMLNFCLLTFDTWRWIFFPYSINIFRDENWENDAYKILSLVSPDEEGNTGVLIKDNKVSLQQFRKKFKKQ